MLIYNDEKFWVAEQLGFQNWPKPAKELHATGKNKIATVYQMWSTEAYLPYLYHSIISQLMYTDMAEKSDVWIFVHDQFYEYTVHLMRGLVHEENIISVTSKDAVKYVVTSHPTLQDYEIITVCDSDMFFYSETRVNMYSNIEEYYKNYDGILLIEDVNYKAEQTFWDRHANLNKNVPAEEYLDFFTANTGITGKNLKKWLKGENWHVSPLFTYKPSTFVNEKYNSFAQACSDKGFMCDETVWMVWAKATNLPIRAIQDEIKELSLTLDFVEDTSHKFIENRDPKKNLSIIHPLTIPNKVNPVCLGLLKTIHRQFRKEYEVKINGTLTVARSWREFDKQQFVALCELADKLIDYKLDIHINVNEYINEDILEMTHSYLNERGHTLKLYTDEHFDDYARGKGIDDEKIEKFKTWKWIYHILLYHSLLHENKVEYLLTYDDDILFNDKPIGELLYLLANRIPFACADQFSDSDKCMMGKLCVYFGSKINDEYYANTSCLFASNSGFMGIDNTMFYEFSTNEQLLELVDLFDYEEWNHKTMTGMGYDKYKILLQEQSFLSIMNRFISNRTHRILDASDEYIISSDLEQIRKSKIEHYVSVSKYSDEYLNKVEKKFRKYKKIVELM